MTAARILKRVDENVKPCDNFYQFACGGWINESVNLNYDSWNTLYSTQLTTHDRIKYQRGLILHANKRRRTGEFYTLDQTGLSMWERFLDELSGWMPELKEGYMEQEERFEIEADEDTKKKRRFEPEDTILAAFNYSVFPLFWAGVEVNYRNSKGFVITVCTDS